MKGIHNNLRDKCSIHLPFIGNESVFDFSKRNILVTDSLIYKKLERLAKGKDKNKIAAEYYCDYSFEISQLQKGDEYSKVFEKLKDCCFEVNTFIYQFDESILRMSRLFKYIDDNGNYMLLKTQRFNYVIINNSVAEILQLINECKSLLEIYNLIKHKEFEVFFMNGKMAKHSWKVDSNTEKFAIKTKVDFLKLIALLLETNLIRLYRIQSHKGLANIYSKLPIKCEEPLANSEKTESQLNNGKKSILFLAETPGAATTGILYIASYLKRNGINAYCQYNNLDVDVKELKNDIKKLLYDIKPDIVAVSIKWFVHMARGLEICKIVKSICKDISIIVGGNTASLYCDEFIKYEYIDYVVSGDGELPILKICNDEENIPNCTYKKDGMVIRNPITYIQDYHNSSEIYLSDLDQILVSKEDLYSVPNYYIYTGKGCSMNCCYCGGCREAQVKQFHRFKPFLRNINEVRKDIVELKSYASTFMFIDSFEVDVLKYYRKVWSNIDLSNHFCHFYLYKIPCAEFVKLLASTFKYIYLNIDLCSLSERHRKQLHFLGLSKPLPLDKEVVDFLEICDMYKNLEISISLISGLPYYNEDDMKQSEIFLKKLLSHKSFKGAEWGKLHAQPGAPIVENCSKYEMITQAVTYKDFMQYSLLNLKETVYPDVYSFKFPYILFKDNGTNTITDRHYLKLYSLIKENYFNSIEKQTAYDCITNYELYQKVNEIYTILLNKGIQATDIIQIIANPSINLVITIIAAKKLTSNLKVIISNNLRTYDQTFSLNTILVDNFRISIYTNKGIVNVE